MLTAVFAAYATTISATTLDFKRYLPKLLPDTVSRVFQRCRWSRLHGGWRADVMRMVSMVPDGSPMRPRAVVGGLVALPALLLTCRPL